MANLTGLAFTNLDLTNMTAFNPPVPIVPTPPNFVLCNSEYGYPLNKRDGIYAAGSLPVGTLPEQYFLDNPSAQYTLPFHATYGGVVISVEVGGPSDVQSISLVPNDIRGMAAYLANRCSGARYMGGFVTKGLGPLINYVTNPKMNLDTAPYPPSTAFITVTLSDHAHSFVSPGDYDPMMATVLQRAEIDVIEHVSPAFHSTIADRVIRFAVQATRMQRLGEIPWWDFVLVGNASRTEALNGPALNITAHDLADGLATSRRRKRLKG
ncbi:hypothetical protein MMC28_002787 [Mycoblastus sanguinarius]|nr:hypothetical protein [Mycoblastus sanguinarius]